MSSTYTLPLLFILVVSLVYKFEKILFDLYRLRLDISIGQLPLKCVYRFFLKHFFLYIQLCLVVKLSIR
jgi:hypothetical protein